jgi:hypothetical protein
MIMLDLLRFLSLNPWRILQIMHSLQSLFMHTLVLSLLSFFEHSNPLRDFVFLLLQMDNEMDAFLTILLLKRLLVEPSGCSVTPRISFLIDTSSSSRTQRVLFFLCLPAHSLNAHLAEFILSQNVQQLFPPVHLYTGSMPTWQSFTKSSLILFSSLTLSKVPSFVHHCTHTQCPLGRALQTFSEILSSIFKLSAKFSLQCTAAHTLKAHLAELYRILNRILFATMFLSHRLTSKVFSNLEVFLLELLTSVLCCSTSLSDSVEFRSASSVHQYSETAVLCHALLA